MSNLDWVDRRLFLKATGGGVLALLAPAAVFRQALGSVLNEYNSPYGPLGPPDANGLRLPPGFSSRVVAYSRAPVLPTTFQWHRNPDGAAVFADAAGGWIYVSNCENDAPQGGVGAIRFAADGTIVDAYSILRGTDRNCSGGATPWGTWLSCEEVPTGLVWECDPLGRRPAQALPALGAFMHEAAVIGADGYVYLTEDELDGRLYRFRPAAPMALTHGVLEVAEAVEGVVVWHPVPDPSGTTEPTRHQVAESTPFARGEGAAVHGAFVYFTTTHDNRVWRYDTGTSRLDCVFDAALLPDAPLRGVDNLAVTPSGDVLVAEDGDDMQLVQLTAGGPLVVVEVVGHFNSEVTGPAFDPSGRRLYFSSQRGVDTMELGLGITYEVTGPFLHA